MIMTPVVSSGTAIEYVTVTIRNTNGSGGSSYIINYVNTAGENSSIGVAPGGREYILVQKNTYIGAPTSMEVGGDASRVYSTGFATLLIFVYGDCSISS